MNFTPPEAKMIARLRKQNGQWKRARWILLVNGVFSAGLSAWMAYLIYVVLVPGVQDLRSFRSDSLNTQLLFMIDLFWSMCFVQFLYAMWCFTTVVVKWDGDPTRVLLLKLLDEQSATS